MAAMALILRIEDCNKSESISLNQKLHTPKSESIFNLNLLLAILTITRNKKLLFDARLCESLLKSLPNIMK